MSHATHAFRRLWQHARQHRRRICVATACSVLNRLFDLAPPALIGAAIDVVVEGEGSMLASLGFVPVRVQLVVLGIATVVIWLLESAFEFAFKVLWRNLAQTVQHELRLEAFAHTEALDMRFFEERNTGGLMAILNDDVNQLERFLNGGANELVQVATSVLIVGATFFAVSPTLALLAFVPIPLILWGSFRFQHRIAPRYAAVRQQAAFINEQLAGSLGGVATVKSFVAEAHEVARLEEHSQRYREHNRAAIRLSSAFSPLIRMVILVGFTTTLIYGGMRAIDGALAVGAYGLLVFLTQRLLWPLTRLGETFDLYQRAMASTARVLDLIDQKSAIIDGPEALTLGEVRGDIAFHEVRFGYDPDRPVLDGVSLEAKAGETVAIVGATGAGKTTIIKLLLRFYDIDAGSLSIDDRELRSLSVCDLRRAIGLVSQDVFLFHGSVRDNISYGTFGADEAAIIAAAKTAEAHAFIRDMPDGYDTIVGERGQKLSGGQRQRLSIARAVLKNPPILVFDEATSAVDNETEAAIQRSLERLAVGRTVILIAHRLSTVRAADRIYVLAGGSVREQGSHGELIANGGLYADLWGVQTGAPPPPTGR